MSLILSPRFAEQLVADMMHHFENEGQVLNALATPPDSNDVQYPLNSSNADGNSSVVRHLTYNYIYNESSTYAVSNEEFEEKVNNNKRQIRIPKKKLLIKSSKSIRIS